MRVIPAPPISRELLAAKAQPYKDLKNIARLLLVRIENLLIFVEKDDFIPLVPNEFRQAYDYTYITDMRPFYNANCFESEDCDAFDEVIIGVETELEKIGKLIRNLKKANSIVVNQIRTSLDRVETNLKQILKMVGPRLRQMGA